VCVCVCPCVFARVCVFVFVRGACCVSSFVSQFQDMTIDIGDMTDW